MLLLAAIQFTTNLDFLIILPLGPQYMRVMHITPAQFNLIVASYAIAAGISGVAAGFFLDRFDRKTALLWLFLGFAAGTLACALSPTYQFLVAVARDCGRVWRGDGRSDPCHRRRCHSGIPAGRGDGHGDVRLLRGIDFRRAAGAGAGDRFQLARAVLRDRDHLRADPHRRGAVRCRPCAGIWNTRWSSIQQHECWRCSMEPNHQMAFIFMSVLTCAGFTIFPTLATYMVYNVGLTEKQLPFIYLTGGLCTLFSMNWVGRWADRAGKRRVFTLMSLSASVPILALTNLPRVPLIAALATSTLLMICMSGRFVPAMAMMTATVESRYRGGFMSVNSSVQQFSCGVAAWVSGSIIGQGANQEITHYPVAGLVSLACVMACIWLARFLRPAPGEVSTAPVFVETF